MAKYYSLLPKNIETSSEILSIIWSDKAKLKRNKWKPKKSRKCLLIMNSKDY